MIIVFWISYIDFFLLYSVFFYGNAVNIKNEYCREVYKKIEVKCFSSRMVILFVGS